MFPLANEFPFRILALLIKYAMVIKLDVEHQPEVAYVMICVILAFETLNNVLYKSLKHQIILVILDIKVVNMHVELLIPKKNHVAS